MKILTNFPKKVLQKKVKNHFCKICVENRKLIFSYENIDKFSKKGSSKKSEEPFL